MKKIDNCTLYCGDCLNVMKKIPDNSIDLVISDPPYYKVVNEKWDYMWKNENDYVEWSLCVLKEISRVLRLGASFYLFGYFRILSLLVPYLKSYELELRQQIIINKGIRAVSGRATKNYKMFPNVTESILFIIKDNKKFTKSFLRKHQTKVGLTSKQINENLGVKSNGGGMWSLYTGENVCEQFPTKELWNKLSKILCFDLKYEKIAQTYNPIMGLTDVWNDINFYKEKHLHPTQKPLSLIERLITVSSNKKDIILDPFMGSGSTGVACQNLNRRFIGIEKDKKYFKIAYDRIKNNKGIF